MGDDSMSTGPRIHQPFLELFGYRYGDNTHSVHCGVKPKRMWPNTHTRPKRVCITKHMRCDNARSRRAGWNCEQLNAHFLPGNGARQSCATRRPRPRARAPPPAEKVNDWHALFARVCVCVWPLLPVGVNALCTHCSLH